MSLNSIEIVHVAALSENLCIGIDNKLPWHIPADMQHFKELTKGGIVIMGRKTFESLPKLLPGREHWVLSRSNPIVPEGVHVRADIHHLLAYATQSALSQGLKQVFVIGGGEVYQQCLPWADRLELTIVRSLVAGDTFFPALSDTWTTHNGWVITANSEIQTSPDGTEFVFRTFRRRREAMRAANAEQAKPRVYRHYKGQLYKVIATSTHTETEESLITYQAMYGAQEVWTRPRSEFAAMVEYVGNQVSRFTPVLG